MIKDKLKDITKDLDTPVKQDSGMFYLLKRKKVKIVIIYEDGSYLETYKKLKDDYFFTIKKKRYQIIPECFIKGKNPTIMYYYNNPAPINFKFEHTKLSRQYLQDPKKKINPMEVNTMIDAAALHSAFSSNMFKGLYGGMGITPKQIIVFLIVGLVAVMIILQLTGTVDIIGNLKGAVTPAGG